MHMYTCHDGPGCATFSSAELENQYYRRCVPYRVRPGPNSVRARPPGGAISSASLAAACSLVQCWMHLPVARDMAAVAPEATRSKGGCKAGGISPSQGAHTISTTGVENEKASLAPRRGKTGSGPSRAAGRQAGEPASPFGAASPQSSVSRRQGVGRRGEQRVLWSARAPCSRRGCAPFHIARRTSAGAVHPNLRMESSVQGCFQRARCCCLRLAFAQGALRMSLTCRTAIARSRLRRRRH
jgi:hypothetical protein